MPLPVASLYVDMPTNAYVGDVFNLESDCRIATIARPYQTRAHQSAIPNGDKWRVCDLSGRVVLVSRLFPTRLAIIKAMGL